MLKRLLMLAALLVSTQLFAARPLSDFLELVAEDDEWVVGELAAIQAIDAAEMKLPNQETKYRATIESSFITLMRIAEDKNLAPLLKQFGLELDYADILDMEGLNTFTFKKNLPTGGLNSQIDAALKIAQPAVETAIKNLNTIPATWNGKIELSSEDYTFIDEPIYIDIADVTYMKAILKSILAAANMAKSYNISPDKSRLVADTKAYEVIKTSSPENADSFCAYKNGDKAKSVKITRTGAELVINVELTEQCLDIEEYDTVCLDIGLISGTLDCPAYASSKEDWLRVSTSTYEEWYWNDDKEDWDISKVAYTEAHIGNEVEYVYDPEYDSWWGNPANPVPVTSCTKEGKKLELRLDISGYPRLASAKTLGVVEMFLDFLKCFYNENEELGWYSSSRDYIDINGTYDYHTLLNQKDTCFDKIRDKAALGKAKTYTLEALKLAQEADRLVRARKSKNEEVYLFNYDSEDEEDLELVSEYLPQAITSISSNKTITIPSEGDEALLWPGKVALGALFAGNITTKLIPPDAGTSVDYVPCLDEITDSTLGGLLPNMSEDNWENLCKDKKLGYRRVPFGLVLDEEPITIEAGKPATLDLEVVGANGACTITTDAKKLPSGLKLSQNKTTKAWSLAGTPTMPGAYTVALTVTDAKKRKVTQELSLVVTHYENDIFEVESDLEFDPGKMIGFVDLLDMGLDFAAGDKLTVSGLPAGLKYDAIAGAIIGTPTTPGTYTVIFTATTVNPKGTYKASATYVVHDFPTLKLIVETGDLDKVESEKGGSLTGGGTFPAGKTVTLTAKPAAGYVFAGWLGLDDERSKYVDPRKSTLKYKTADFDEEIIGYFVSQEEDAESLSFDYMPGINGEDRYLWDEEKGCNVPRPMNVYVGVNTAEQLAVTSITAPTVTVKGLPKGLKFNKDTFKIEGVPTQAGEFEVKVSMKNSSTTIKETFRLISNAMPAWLIGNHSGIVKLCELENNPYYYASEPVSKYGTATMTIGSTGKISGKVLFNGKTTSFSASSIADARYSMEWDREIYHIKAKVVIDGIEWYLDQNIYPGEGYLCYDDKHEEMWMPGLGRTFNYMRGEEPWYYGSWGFIGLDPVNGTGYGLAYVSVGKRYFDSAGLWYRQNYESRVKDFGKLPSVKIAGVESDMKELGELNVKISAAGKVTVYGKYSGKTALSASTNINYLEVVDNEDGSKTYDVGFDVVFPKNDRVGFTGCAIHVEGIRLVIRNGQFLYSDTTEMKLETRSMGKVYW